MLYTTRHAYIKWPGTPAEMKTVSSGFQFPFTIGAIDGAHIQIKAPLQKLDSYTNRKSYTSVVLQAVCDSSMRFTDISVGWSGSMHDARIFHLSALGSKLQAQNINPYHLLGDSAYPLLPYMMVPFRDNGHLSPDEKMVKSKKGKVDCRNKENKYDRLVAAVDEDREIEEKSERHA